jgi:hypothetical protein
MGIGLETLPPELLTLILEQLDEWRQFWTDPAFPARLDRTEGARLKQLHSVCLASRTLYHAALPFLYLRLCGICYHDGRKEGPERLFVRSLCSSPSLAKHVKHLSFEACVGASSPSLQDKYQGRACRTKHVC